MRRDPARTARRALLGLVLVVCLAVAWHLLRPKPPDAAPRPAPSPGAGTTVGELDFLRYKDDNRKIDVKAREMVKQQGDTMLMHGVDASMPFVNEGRASVLKIQARSANTSLRSSAPRSRARSCCGRTTASSSRPRRSSTGATSSGPSPATR
jgi:hypothetical protein